MTVRGRLLAGDCFLRAGLVVGERTHELGCSLSVGAVLERLGMLPYFQFPQPAAVSSLVVPEARAAQESWSCCVNRALMALSVMSSVPSTLVFVDLETGGLNPTRHPIIQLAAVALDGATLASLETIELKVRFDERKAAKFALRKNSYSRRIWQEEAFSEEEAARRFADFLRRHATYSVLTKDGAEYRLAQLVAHNAAFDAAFLQAWYERLKIFCPARHQVLCTLQRSLWHFIENPCDNSPHNFKLATLCHFFGISFSAADAHDALGDVQATVALYKALISRVTAAPYSTAA